MNVPQTSSQNLPATDDFNPYLDYGRSAVQTTIVGHLLKFTKFGDWTAGENNAIVKPGSLMLAHIPESLIGWQKWQDNKPVEQIMWKLSEGREPPKRATLGDTDREHWEVDDQGKERDPWQFSNMLLLKAADSDELYTFATASKGGLQAIGKLCIAFGQAMRHKPGMLPVVKLDRGSYDHPNRAYGEIRTPILELVDWAPRQAFDLALDPSSAQGQLPIEETKPVAIPGPNKKTRF